MKVYTKEQISALLEKAASEIEMRDAEIARLQAELEEARKSATVGTMVKEASAADDTGWYQNDMGLGMPSSITEQKMDAKAQLESFLSNLA